MGFLYAIYQFKHRDEGEEVVARDIHGLRYAIQDELSTMRVTIVGKHTTYDKLSILVLEEE